MSLTLGKLGRRDSRLCEGMPASPDARGRGNGPLCIKQDAFIYNGRVVYRSVGASYEAGMRGAEGSSGHPSERGGHKGACGQQKTPP